MRSSEEANAEESSAGNRRRQAERNEHSTERRPDRTQATTRSKRRPPACAFCALIACPWLTCVCMVRTAGCLSQLTRTSSCSVSAPACCSLETEETVSLFCSGEQWCRPARRARHRQPHITPASPIPVESPSAPRRRRNRGETKRPLGDGRLLRRAAGRSGHGTTLRPPVLCFHPCLTS